MDEVYSQKQGAEGGYNNSSNIKQCTNKTEKQNSILMAGVQVQCRIESIIIIIIQRVNTAT